MSDPDGRPAQTGNPFLGGRPNPPSSSSSRSSRSARPAADTRSTIIAVGLAVVFNAITILGVVGFGWPAGNVFVLYWAENVILGVFTVVKIATARAPGGSRTGLPFFFCFHYGLFCVVQGVFTMLVAYRIGVELSFLLLWFPMILLFTRYLVETVTVWFGPGRQRDHVSPSRAMSQPYPRIFVLQFAVIISFIATLGGLQVGRLGGVLDGLHDLAGTLAPGLLARGVAYVVLLMLIKTVVDIGTTYRAVTR